MRPGPVEGFADALVTAWGATGLPQPAGIYPRWAVYAFEAGGEVGLRIAACASDESRDSIKSARHLGGTEAVRGLLESLADSTGRHSGT